MQTFNEGWKVIYWSKPLETEFAEPKKKKAQAWLQSRHERILYSTTLHAKGNIIIVATRGTSGFSHAIGTVIFSVLGWCNLFLGVEIAANCHAMGFGKNSKQNKCSSFRQQVLVYRPNLAKAIYKHLDV